VINNAQLNELKNTYVANGAASPATYFADRAENSVIWDVDGNSIVDFAGGIGVLNIGHCHPKVVAPVQAHVAKLMHPCQIVIPYAGYVKVAKKLS
jgi:4-aminobutyrate aminotransferase/(S)-3-amino-2-methylpropionate transaminase